MNNITVFNSEKEAGLEKQIKEHTSLAYVSQLCPAYPETENPELNQIISSAHQKTSYKDVMETIRTQAGHQDTDVYQPFSILVSTAWNKNDDVFNSQEVWAAKETL